MFVSILRELERGVQGEEGFVPTSSALGLIIHHLNWSWIIDIMIFIF